MAGVVLLSRSSRPRQLMHGNAWTFSEQSIASITDDSRRGMSDVAVRTAPHQLLYFLVLYLVMWCLLAVWSDVISCLQTGRLDWDFDRLAADLSWQGTNLHQHVHAAWYHCAESRLSTGYYFISSHSHILVETSLLMVGRIEVEVRRRGMNVSGKT